MRNTALYAVLFAATSCYLNELGKQDKTETEVRDTVELGNGITGLIQEYNIWNPEEPIDGLSSMINEVNNFASQKFSDKVAVGRGANDVADVITDATFEFFGPYQTGDNQWTVQTVTLQNGNFTSRNETHYDSAEDAIGFIKQNGHEPTVPTGELQKV